MQTQLEEEPQWDCHVNSNTLKNSHIEIAMARLDSHQANMRLPPLTQIEEEPHWDCHCQMFWQRKSHCEIAKRGATVGLVSHPAKLRLPRGVMHRRPHLSLCHLSPRASLPLIIKAVIHEIGRWHRPSRNWTVVLADYTLGRNWAMK